MKRQQKREEVQGEIHRRCLEGGGDAAGKMVMVTRKARREDGGRDGRLKGDEGGRGVT